MSVSSPIQTTAPLSLKIEMDLDIQHAEAVHKLLREQPDSPAMELDLGAVAACDLTGLQLLLSMQRTVSGTRKKFSIRACSPAVAAACTGLGLDVSQLSISIH